MTETHNYLEWKSQYEASNSLSIQHANDNILTEAKRLINPLQSDTTQVTNSRTRLSQGINLYESLIGQEKTILDDIEALQDLIKTTKENLARIRKELEIHGLSAIDKLAKSLENLLPGR